MPNARLERTRQVYPEPINTPKVVWTGTVFVFNGPISTAVECPTDIRIVDDSAETPREMT